MNNMTINTEVDCECRGMDMGYLCEYDTGKALQAEKVNSQILSLYRQMKLQNTFEKCDSLESGFRESQMYTNKRLLNDIATQIQEQGVNYPKTFQSLTNDINTNTILTSIQLREQHLQTDPLTGEWGVQ